MRKKEEKKRRISKGVEGHVALWMSALLWYASVAFDKASPPSSQLHNRECIASGIISTKSFIICHMMSETVYQASSTKAVPYTFTL